MRAPHLFDPNGVADLDEDAEIFLSVLAQEVIADGFIHLPLSEAGNFKPGRIECTMSYLRLPHQQCAECSKRFPRTVSKPCWFDESFTQAFGISLNQVRSVFG